MYKVRVSMMIVFCFICFRCPAVCSALLPTSVTLNASLTNSHARHAHNSLSGRTVEDRCMSAGAIWCSSCFLCFNVLLYCCLFNFVLLLLVLCVFPVVELLQSFSFFIFIGLIFLMKCVLLQLLCFCAVSLLLFLLCSDGELVCAEGYTQVTGVIWAMMMTGRVLLVCALCVLWCDAAGVHARELENNALGGCMVSGVLGTNGSHVSSGCEKSALTLPLRSVLSVTVAEVTTGEEESETKLKNPELNPLPPPVSGGSQGVSGGSSGVGGPSGYSSGSGVNALGSPFSAATSSPPHPIDSAGLEDSKGTTSTLSIDASETGVQSQSAGPPLTSAQRNLDRQDVSTSNAENHSSIKPHTAGNSNCYWWCNWKGER
ncbi:mucin-associated surface protein (MASP), putative, partial [Trypanosoma cruzi marinkellei]